MAHRGSAEYLYYWRLHGGSREALLNTAAGAAKTNSDAAQQARRYFEEQPAHNIVTSDRIQSTALAPQTASQFARTTATLDKETPQLHYSSGTGAAEGGWVGAPTWHQHGNEGQDKRRILPGSS